MNHSERNRELLKRIQQKAEALRETRDSNDQFETELEAVQEVYGLSDSEMKRITEEAAREVDSEDQSSIQQNGIQSSRTVIGTYRFHHYAGDCRFDPFHGDSNHWSPFSGRNFYLPSTPMNRSD